MTVLRPVLDVLIVASTYLAATGLLAWLARLLGRRGADGSARQPAVSWWPVLLSGILLGGAARWFAGVVRLGSLDLALSLWAVLFVLGFLLSAIEATVFAAGRGPIRPADILGAFLLTGVTAAVAGAVMASTTESSLLQQLQLRIATIGWDRLALLVCGAAIAYMVAYCVLGSMAWRFIGPYYTDPAHGLRLRVPSAAVILPLQVGRGLVATTVLLPFLLSATEQDLQWWLGLSVSLALVAAVVPLLNARDWPCYLRLVHGIEIALFCFVQAASLWWLF